MADDFDDRVLGIGRKPGESIVFGLAGRAAEARREPSPRERAPGDARIFQDMVERSKQVFSRYTIYRTGERAQPAARMSDATQSFGKERLKIVCVGSELHLGPEGDLAMQPLRDGCRLLKPTGRYRRSLWIDDRLRELRVALEDGPDIVVFPEFAYPPILSGDDGTWAWADVAQMMDMRAEFHTRATELLGDRDVFLVLGSFHCMRSLYNIGVIFPWGAWRDGQARFTQRREEQTSGLIYKEDHDVDDRIVAPVLYRKRFPARKVGEQARTPSGRDFNVFKCAFGNVAVLICSDILDANQFVTVVREALLAGDKLVDYVIIAAYNPAPSFNLICEDLSALAATTVIVANASNRRVDLQMPDSDVFVCGRSSGDLKRSPYPEQRTLVKRLRAKTVGDSRLFRFEIDVDGVNHARNAQRTRMGVHGGSSVLDKGA